MKLNKFGLLPRIALAIIVGILTGMVAPGWLAQLCATFNAIYSQFLGFMIPLIIVGFVVPAIGDIGSKAGRMLVLTVLIAYGFTIASGLLSYFTCSIFFPGMLHGQIALTAQESAIEKIAPWFTVEMPPLMGVTSSLVLAFLLGLGIAFSRAETIGRGFSEFRDIVSKTINTAIIPLLPIYIFGIFLIMTVEGEVAVVLRSFIKVIGIIFVLHVVVLLLQYLVAAPFARRNPLSMLRTMLPAYFTALGTQSSAATIPVTLRQAISMGVREDVAGFVIPLCATIHLSGSTLKIVACALAILIMHGEPHSLPLFLHFIMMLGITMVAAPGIPGGAIMASLGLLQSILGFDSDSVALMIALYIAMDSFGTACNVTGDGAIAAIINRIS
ncbi:MAG: dicarboxylate/amino acid:cation symporter [Bacteroides sp.]|nr:dicarboxylate/amino acid:cation symporter [Bacteroides sp.]